MKSIKCVIFDVDGTLARTNQLILESFNFITAKYLNRTYRFEEITKMFGPPEEVALENLLGVNYSDEVFKEFLTFYKKHHKKLASLYPGIKDVLIFLRNNGIILSVFTGKGKNSTLITLEELEIKDFFDMIVTGNDVINHKPAGEGINKILDCFGMGKDNVIMIGDSVSDVKAAKEAKIKFGAALWDSYSKEKVLLEDVDYVFENIEQLKIFLKNNI
ncbi:MAG: Phosphoglycolate phosphatase [Ignavibacteriae bacterium]|nr:MAG: Phosphoglycolate phosphatase [Ignavibacteriota bacterium]